MTKFPQGATIDAWYDRKNPSQAVIDRSLGTVHYVFLAALGGFAVIFAIAWMFNRRNRLKHSEPPNGDNVTQHAVSEYDTNTEQGGR